MAPSWNFLWWRELIPFGPMDLDDLARQIAFLCRQARKTAFLLMAADGIAV